MLKLKRRTNEEKQSLILKHTKDIRQTLHKVYQFQNTEIFYASVGIVLESSKDTDVEEELNNGSIKIRILLEKLDEDGMMSDKSLTREVTAEELESNYHEVMPYSLPEYVKEHIMQNSSKMNKWSLAVVIASLLVIITALLTRLNLFYVAVAVTSITIINPIYHYRNNKRLEITIINESKKVYNENIKAYLDSKSNVQ